MKQDILLIELVAGTNKARAIVFDTDEHGCRTVKDIYEHDADKLHTMSRLAHDLKNMVFAECHSDVDFGRATRMQTKVRKLVEHLQRNA